VNLPATPYRTQSILQRPQISLKVPILSSFASSGPRFEACRSPAEMVSAALLLNVRTLNTKLAKSANRSLEREPCESVTEGRLTQSATVRDRDAERDE